MELQLEGKILADVAVVGNRPSIARQRWNTERLLVERLLVAICFHRTYPFHPLPPPPRWTLISSFSCCSSPTLLREFPCRHFPGRNNSGRTQSNYKDEPQRGCHSINFNIHHVVVEPRGVNARVIAVWMDCQWRVVLCSLQRHSVCARNRLCSRPWNHHLQRYTTTTTTTSNQELARLFRFSYSEHFFIKWYSGVLLQLDTKLFLSLCIW